MLNIEEITEDRWVSKAKESGTTATSKRVKNWILAAKGFAQP
jgi:hypothetical protein